MTLSSKRDVLVTGIGLISALGEGLDDHWQALNAAANAEPAVDRQRFSPYPLHPIVALDYDKQIPKRDQRQMEPWQRIGTYAAGLALEHAGVQGNEDILSRTDMIVSAGGGERDITVDSAILAEIVEKNEFGTILNERLSNDLRPTLFLAQLPNLLAGNISIVHKVTGSSRTFMGEEAAGIDAVRTAHARITSGQSEICLVGGSYNAERLDMLLLYEMGGYLWREGWLPVWERISRGGGIITGSMGAFLVLESPEHANARGAKAVARLRGVLGDRCRRAPGEAALAARRQLDVLRTQHGMGGLTVLSGATGSEPITSEERDFLTSLRGAANDVAVRAAASAIGHGFEAQFPALVALATLFVQKGTLYPPIDKTGFETNSEAVRDVLVTCWGHWRGEGMALLSAPH